MRHYEVIFLVHPDQSEQVPAMVDRYRALLESNGGTIHRFEDWGRRQMAYMIEKVYKAHYVLMNIECDGNTLTELNSMFKFSDAVIRNLVVATEAEPWSAMTETLLMYAARSDHLENTIRPALAAGDWVVCDRFADSSRAYQGAGGGVAQDFIEQIDAAVVADDQPDLTLVFDLPVEVGLERAFGRGLFETRFESKGLAFHQRLREGFLRIVETNPDRCVRIDAVGDLDTVEERVWRAVQARVL